MMMKQSICEMKINQEYWIDNNEDISGSLTSINDEYICFTITSCEINNEYKKTIGDFICFPYNDYLYKPKN